MMRRFALDVTLKAKRFASKLGVLSDIQHMMPKGSCQNEAFYLKFNVQGRNVCVEVRSFI